MKLVQRRVSVRIPQLLATPISALGEDEDHAYEVRERVLLEWAETSSVSYAAADRWKHVALFLANQILPGMQLGLPKRVGRPRKRGSGGIFGGPTSSLSREEGNWLVRSIDELRKSASSRGESMTVGQAAARLKIDGATKKRVSDRAPSTLRRQYFEQKKLEVRRQRIERDRRELVESHRRRPQ